jgi:hypothetical protein
MESTRHGPKRDYKFLEAFESSTVTWRLVRFHSLNWVVLVHESPVQNEMKPSVHQLQITLTNNEIHEFIDDAMFRTDGPERNRDRRKSIRLSHASKWAIWVFRSTSKYESRPSCIRPTFATPSMETMNRPMTRQSTVQSAIYNFLDACESLTVGWRLARFHSSNWAILVCRSTVRKKYSLSYFTCLRPKAVLLRILNAWG